MKSTILVASLLLTLPLPAVAQETPDYVGRRIQALLARTYDPITNTTVRYPMAPAIIPSRSMRDRFCVLTDLFRVGSSDLRPAHGSPSRSPEANRSVQLLDALPRLVVAFLGCELRTPLAAQAAVPDRIEVDAHLVMQDIDDTGSGKHEQASD
jgi:hypothetical protein